MPVERSDLDLWVFPQWNESQAAHHDQPAEQDKPDSQVNGVNAGQHPIKRKEQSRRRRRKREGRSRPEVLAKIFGILKALEHKKHRTESCSGGEGPDRETAQVAFG